MGKNTGHNAKSGSVEQSKIDIADGYGPSNVCDRVWFDMNEEVHLCRHANLFHLHNFIIYIYIIFE